MCLYFSLDFGVSDNEEEGRGEPKGVRGRRARTRCGRRGVRARGGGRGARGGGRRGTSSSESSESEMPLVDGELEIYKLQVV
jgi:hypothetical protein